MWQEVRRTEWQSHRFDALIAKNLAERFAELRAPNHDQVTLVIQEPVLKVRQFAANLLHPVFVRIRCATGDVDSAGLQFHDEQEVEGH